MGCQPSKLLLPPDPLPAKETVRITLVLWRRTQLFLAYNTNVHGSLELSVLYEDLPLVGFFVDRDQLKPIQDESAALLRTVKMVPKLFKPLKPRGRVECKPPHAARSARVVVGVQVVVVTDDPEIKSQRDIPAELLLSLVTLAKVRMRCATQCNTCIRSHRRGGRCCQRRSRPKRCSCRCASGWGFRSSLKSAFACGQLCQLLSIDEPVQSKPHVDDEEKDEEELQCEDDEKAEQEMSTNFEPREHWEMFCWPSGLVALHRKNGVRGWGHEVLHGHAR